MPYCIYCGVKINDRHSECPLCHNQLEYPEKRESLPPLYPDDVNKISTINSTQSSKDRITIHFLLFFALIISLVTTGIDYTITNDFTWSRFTVTSITLIFLGISAILSLKRKPVILYITLNILIGLYLFVIDVITPETSWFIKFALPCFILLQAISIVIFILFKTTMNPLQRAVIVLLGVNTLLLGINHIVTTRISWSLISTAILIPTSLYLLYLSIKLQDHSH